MLLVRGWTYGRYGTCLPFSVFVEYHEFFWRQPARYLMYLVLCRDIHVALSLYGIGP